MCLPKLQCLASHSVGTRLATNTNLPPSDAKQTVFARRGEKGLIARSMSAWEIFWLGR